MNPALREYEANIDAICGTMVRHCFSLPGQRRKFHILAADSSVPLDTQLHSASFDPEKSDVIHSATMRNQLDALADGGYDEVLFGNVCVSYIYSLWEDKYRPQIAQLRGGENKSEVRNDLMAELGAYRHAIIHNAAIGTSKTAKLKVLPSVPRGSPVKVDRHAFELLVTAIKKELRAISAQIAAAQQSAAADAAARRG